MKQVRKLKLSQLSKNELEKKELKKLKGGEREDDEVE